MLPPETLIINDAEHKVNFINCSVDWWNEANKIKFPSDRVWEKV